MLLDWVEKDFELGAHTKGSALDLGFWAVGCRCTA